MKKLFVFGVLFFNTAINYGLLSEINNFFEVYYSNPDTPQIRTNLFSMLSNITVDDQVEQLYLDGFIANMHVIIMTEKHTKEMLKTDIDKVKKIHSQMEAYASTHADDQLGSDFFALLGDLQIRLMNSVGWTGLISYANSAKKNYQKAVDLEPTNSMGYLKLGQWHYFASRVNKLELNKALEYFNLAEQHAEQKYQKYLVNIWKSQVYFKKGNKEQTSLLLDQAAKIFPNSQYHNYAKAKNADNKTL